MKADEVYGVNCLECGMSFAVPIFWLQARVNDHRNFFCPNGHILYYPPKNNPKGDNVLRLVKK